MTNLANPELVPSVDSVSEKQEAAAPAALDSELEDTEVKKMFEEHKQLVSSLRAELEDQKSITRTILDEVRVLKMSADVRTAENAESKTTDTKQQCLEWTAFMEHLQSLKFFEDENEESASDTHSVFDDPIRVRRAIYTFARAHESVFESLSPIDLRIIARHGSSANDSKASAGQRKLCKYFHLEDLPSDAGASKPASTQPRLFDVTRLLYSTVLEGTYRDDVKLSISHLLREVVILSKRPSVVPLVPLPPAAETPLGSKLGAAFSAVASDMSYLQPKQDKEQEFTKEKGKGLQKIGTAKQEEPMKAAARAEARPGTSAEAPQWKCPRCSFMNLDTKHRCVECSRRRPQRTYGSDAVKSSNVSLVEEELDAKVLVEGRQAKSAHGSKGNLPFLSTQGLENLKDQSSSLAIQEQDTALCISETESGSEGSKTFSLLDGILDSEDLSDDQEQEGKIGDELLDGAEEEHQGEGKRVPLSNLFPKMKPKASSRRGGRQESEQRNGRRSGDRPSKNKRFKDDDDNERSLHVPSGEDSEDDDPSPHRSGRGFNDDLLPRRSRGGLSGDNSRNRGRGGNDSFRGRGGGQRGGFGGGRGDFLESRHNDGGLRGSGAYGERDRGGRSSSWSSRPSRGKPRF